MNHSTFPSTGARLLQRNQGIWTFICKHKNADSSAATSCREKNNSPILCTQQWHANVKTTFEVDLTTLSTGYFCILTKTAQINIPINLLPT